MLRDPIFSEALFPTEQTCRNYESRLSEGSEMLAKGKSTVLVEQRSELSCEMCETREFSLLLEEREEIYTNKELNYQQLEAVESIAAVAQSLGQRANPLDALPLPPLIIYGPPGTGMDRRIIYLRILYLWKAISFLLCGHREN